jgi:copper chaperone CopZ
MKLLCTFVVGVSAALLATTASAAVTVELSNMHICCGGCVKAIDVAVKGMPGVKVTADQGTETTTIVADNAMAAQKAISAIAAAGYFGKSNHATLAMKDDSGAPSGNVKRLELTGIHNCCGKCTKAAQAAMQSVPGVKSDNLVPKQSTFVVEGDFSAHDLVKALNDAGFHVKVK